MSWCFPRFNRALCAGLAWLVFAGIASTQSSPESGPKAHWKIRYQYDRDRVSWGITDVVFPTPQRGVAVGVLTNARGKDDDGLVLVTRDAGKTWTEVPIKEPALSVFFLNESTGWIVTPNGLWRTDESGLSWRKVKGLKGIERVHFLTEDHGFAVGSPKLMMETKDGGKTWTDVAAAKEVKSNPDYTAYHWIEFQTPTRALASGTVVPPRPFESGEPAWIDPEHASKRRQWPTLMITLESRDGGATWTSDTAPTFGYPRRFRFGPAGRALAVLQFENAFEYPSEVYVVEKGKSRRVLREKQLLVSDVGWLGPDRAIAAAVQTPSMHQIPVPGKLKVLTTDNLGDWSEMEVDWKAYARQAVVATSGGQAWIGTDTGLLLQLVTE